jgi:threonine dehydrogenase-like Zn-dependent dehydrogenase
MGLGPVGNLAAQIFQIAGYLVTGIDPIQSRCDAAAACGVSDTRTELDLTDKNLAAQVSLVVECSGHEQAVLSGCGIVKKGGEVVLVGVPWKKLTDHTAHELLHLVFHKYVVLRSGWEWQVPREPTPFMQGSIDDNFKAALLWLSQGRIRTEPLADVAKPQDCQRVYQDLMHRRTSRPVTMFDWR